ncbi:unnamed protein product [Gadus morhua 'NCC']
MAAEGGGKETNEIKTQFTTREGVYKLLTHSEYSRPNRVPFNSQGSNPVKVSFVNVNDQSGNGDRICFNVGRELYFYIYKGVRKAADLSKPIDKRIYKGTQPTCHDFNPLTATADSVSLLVGFSAGQVQLIDPIKKETSKLFNEERLIDKSRVTCVRWVPGSESLFLVAHSSGSMYLYNVENTLRHHAAQLPAAQARGRTTPCTPARASRPATPCFAGRWARAPSTSLPSRPTGSSWRAPARTASCACSGFDAAELHGTMKSYFGGLLCVCWSPDGQYIVAGGEDDLVTVWSFSDCRVIARGHGHKSWVSVVAFDHCTTSVEDSDLPAEFSGSDEEYHEQTNFGVGRDRANSAQSRLSKRNSTDGRPVSVTYRFGSVGQDTQMCLWDLTEDILFPHLPLSRTRTHTNVMSATSSPAAGTVTAATTAAAAAAGNSSGTNGSNTGSTSGNNSGNTVLIPFRPPCRGLTAYHTPTPKGALHPTATRAATAAPPRQPPRPRPPLPPPPARAGSIIDSTFIATGVSKFATLSLHDSRKDRHEKDHKRNHSMGHINSKSSDKLNQLSSSRTAKADAAKTLGTTLCPRMEEVPLLEPAGVQENRARETHRVDIPGGLSGHSVPGRFCLHMGPAPGKW